MSQDIRDVVAFLVDHTELRFLEMDAPSTVAVRSDDNTGGAVVGVDEDKDGPDTPGGVDTQADIASLAQTHYQAHMVDTDEDTGETVVVDLFDPVETPDASVETATTSASMTAVLPSMGDVITAGRGNGDFGGERRSDAGRPCRLCGSSRLSRETHRGSRASHRCRQYNTKRTGHGGCTESPRQSQCTREIVDCT